MMLSISHDIQMFAIIIECLHSLLSCWTGQDYQKNPQKCNEDLNSKHVFISNHKHQFQNTKCGEFV